MSKEVKEEVKENTKYKEEDLLAIFDTLMFEGKYTEDVMIKGKLKVTFRSMSAKDVSETSALLDSKNYILYETMQQQRALLNLSRCLDFYNQKDLSTMTSDNKMAFIEGLPAAMVAALSDSLGEFSVKVMKACEVGEKNF
jgi:hypothetical protein